MPSHRDRSRSRSRDRGQDRDRERERERERRKDRSSRDDKDRDHGSSRRDRDREHDRERDSRKHRDKERSNSPERKKSKRRDERDEESSDDDGLDLAEMGVKEISEDDYFLKASEFKRWLKEERGRYLDEMSSESAHKYFRKFVRRWNDGQLKPEQYKPVTAIAASEQTGYKWSFKPSGAGPSLAQVREDVARSTHSSTQPGVVNPAPVTSYGVNAPVGPALPPSSRSLGPSLPSAADRQYALEAEQEARRFERKARNKEIYEKADEYVPKTGGKEGKMEERRATNAENRKFRDKDMAAGLELDEGTLMGDSGGFAAALRARDAASARRNDRKDTMMQDRRAADQDRLSERRAKESATMDMFKAMARERFG
ncbi:hypothetical protein IAU60_005188 [Kwoniella sp. DSM 27419]